MFEGKAVARGGTRDSDGMRLRAYTFEVNRVWKGRDDREVKVYSYDRGQDSCGFTFETGQTYLVYASLGQDKLLKTNLCSGNLPVSEAQRDLIQLGTGQSVNPTAGTEKDGKDWTSLLWLAGGILLVSAAWLTGNVYRTRRRR
ncbi:hypothetical protein J31TS4_34420 [Paenibacillus sp. J31TS4]|uniref:hypothetical protein n=1 Tax=Paenibacillus sp. J31TS4 TaxID=2807195 RepID=UPI001B157806|nr:hypothetical protein [Paenibacillus sp. J31TS4]GIP40162.1 hypothetical protein J31TS4_34420 [Paenibacillus sp. J31TS4]